MELSELIESIDILEYISQYCEFEEKNGEYWALSPLKEEKTPSFSVRTNPPCFYDYSSGIGGNVFTFVRYYHRCGASEAIEILKRYAGLDGTTVAPREKMSASLVCKKYRKPKQPTKQSKGITLPDSYMERFERRPEKLQVWMDEGISADVLEKFQVRYDAFSDRLVFPIKNCDNKIANVSGRTLDPDWKGKGLRKYTYFFGWGKMEIVYGLPENMEEILQKREVILFEGCKSVLLAHTWGIKNCGAILTSHLSQSQMKILAKLGCRVVFALDKEIRIRDDRNIQKLTNYVEVEYLWDREDFLGEKDAPVDKGKEIFEKLYEGRLRYH